MPEYDVVCRKLHRKQREISDSEAKRIVIRAGRRGGKTVLMAWLAVHAFLSGRRVLYATPTTDQLGSFWFEVKRAFQQPLAAGYLYKHEGLHLLTLPDVVSDVEGEDMRDFLESDRMAIRGKTAWNVNTMRGDYADILFYDEFQLMNEDAWGRVGAPMLLDNDGDAYFVYTPPSLRSTGASKAEDPRHASKMYKRAEKDESGRWAAFTFTSHDNPYISEDALSFITEDMTSLAYRQEILAEDIEDNPSALWKREWIRDNRVLKPPGLARVAVAVDPTASKGGDECGILGGGMDVRDGRRHLYVMEDASLHGSPDEWGRAAVTLYHKLGAGILVAEKNNGGEMVESTIKTVDSSVNVKLVHASRGKRVRAEPISAVYEQGRGHHVGQFPLLEDEQCQWEPGQDSPNRMDALVWLGTELVLQDEKVKAAGDNVEVGEDSYRTTRRRSIV